MKLTPSGSPRAASLGVAASFVPVPQEDDADAHEDAHEVDEQLHGVPREVSVPKRGLLHDELGVEDHVAFGRFAPPKNITEEKHNKNSG